MILEIKLCCTVQSLARVRYLIFWPSRASHKFFGLFIGKIKSQHNWKFDIADVMNGLLTGVLSKFSGFLAGRGKLFLIFHVEFRVTKKL